MNHKFFRPFLLSSFVALALGCTFLTSSSSAQKNSATGTPGLLPAVKPGDPLPANAFVELAKVMNPTVVNISTSTLPRRQGPQMRDPYFDMLEQFFGFRAMPQQRRPQQSLGTGFIIREDGLIVTNNHVIAGADVIQVQLADDDKNLFQAEIIGSDDRTDIALIKIDVKRKLPFAALGSSKELEVGEWVAAFGNPFGQGHTMTKGIISAKGRDIGEINRFPLIQTDTPINPGNSGGPLVNLRGQVIGVNAAIDPRAQGIGFAIPIDEVKEILPKLERDGRIKKGFLGVNPGDLDPAAAAQLGLESADGAIILGLDRQGPGAKSGLRLYDVIVEFNGRKVTSSADLVNAVADSPIGKDVSAKIIREGKSRELKIRVGERPEQVRAQRQQTRERSPTQKAPFDLGFSMIDLTENTRNDYQIPQDLAPQGALVVEINPRSKAAAAGLAVGDVILDVNKEEVKDSKDVLRKLRKDVNTLRVARSTGIRIIVIRN